MDLLSRANQIRSDYGFGGLLIRGIEHFLIIPIQNYYYRFTHGNGLDVMEEDWDNLILLDACRYDYFQKENQLPGELSQVPSGGGHSWEFMEHNFVGRNLHDTVYVTANPYAERIGDDVFYTVYSVLDQWDDDLETIAPEDVVSVALKANDSHPKKRLVVHFMQPHEPWIGPTMEKIKERVSLTGWDRYHGRDDTSNELQGINPWRAVQENIISGSEMHQAYRESLQTVLKHVQNLVTDLDGKSVVSADHGELLGERIAPFLPRKFGHPHGLYIEETCLVPWLELPFHSRRRIVSEQPIGFENLEEEILNKRLQALGYTGE